MGDRSKALFAGCARNCAAMLPAVLSNMERIATLYAEAAFVIVENDSSDNTNAILGSWCSTKKNAQVINLDGLAFDHPVRTDRLAIARGAYIKALKRDFGDYTHLFVMDCDDVNMQPLDLGCVARAVEFLESDPSHAGAFANQGLVYYDLWPLRHPQLCPGDAWEEVLDCAIASGLGDQAAFDQTFARRLFSLLPDGAPLEVDSAFGGLGIYKVASVLRNRRDFTGYKKKQVPVEGVFQEIGWQISEHVSFNLGLREQEEKLFILPYLVNVIPRKAKFAPSFFRSAIFDLRWVSPGGISSFSIGPDELCPCRSQKLFKDCHGVNPSVMPS